MSELGHSLDHLGRLEEAEALLVSVTGGGHASGRPVICVFISPANWRPCAGTRVGSAMPRPSTGDLSTIAGPYSAPSIPYTLIIVNNLGLVLEEEKKYGEAERLLRECLRLGREVRTRASDTLVKLGSLAGTREPGPGR